MGKPYVGPIRIGNADGGHFRAATSPRTKTEEDGSPDWSPDGAAIAFSRYVYYGPHTDYKRAGLWLALSDDLTQFRVTLTGPPEPLLQPQTLIASVHIATFRRFGQAPHS